MAFFEKYGHIRTENMVEIFKIKSQEEYLKRKDKFEKSLETVKKYFFSEDPEENTRVRIWEAMGTACLIWEIDNNLLKI